MKVRKIIFLDVDGVLNSKDTLTRSSRSVLGIDPYLMILVDRIIQSTGAEVVLSSSWRHSEEGKAEVMKCIPFIDITPTCCTGIRGAEIHRWISKNVPHEEKESLRYAILDDDSDMLLWQKDDFFQTSFNTGITEEIARKVINHLNKP